MGDLPRRAEGAAGGATRLAVGGGVISLHKTAFLRAFLRENGSAAHGCARQGQGEQRGRGLRDQLVHAGPAFTGAVKSVSRRPVCSVRRIPSTNEIHRSTRRSVCVVWQEPLRKYLYPG